MECPLAGGTGLGGRTEQSVGRLANDLAPPALQGQQVVGTLGSEGSWLSESDHESFSLGHTEHSGVAEVSEKKTEGQAWEAGPTTRSASPRHPVCPGLWSPQLVSAVQAVQQPEETRLGQQASGAVNFSEQPSLAPVNLAVNPVLSCLKTTPAASTSSFK